MIDQPEHSDDAPEHDDEATDPGASSSHFETADSSTPAPHEQERVPDQIGPYKPIARLGAGGMGVVYLAEQGAPIQRRVALKIVRAGLNSEQVIARFEAERQALALMDHPGIAKVFDAGTTDDGRPFFVMEYVKGVPINEHCDRNRFSVADRLRLMIDVCSAVQHAHQKGVIHRDLKPSNILVAYQDGVAQPKVIDFGVAKATSQRLSEKEFFTEFGQLIGTPEYMSPEQAEMTGQDIDTRSDIYSLGVILYELLIGLLPFDSATLRSAGYAEIQRIIREVDPPRPSTKLTTQRDQSREMLSSAAKNRATDALELTRELRGDLDWVVMKAIEKDRTRRYSAVAEFAQDLEAYLHHDPVRARPPSVSYKTRKFIRRHRLLVGSASAIAAAIVIGAVGITWQARIAMQQRDRAELRLAEGRALADALLGDVQTAVINLEGSTEARKLLTEAALQYLNSLDDAALGTPESTESAADAYLRLGDVMGATFVGNLGESGQAEQAFTRAIELRQRLVDSSPADTSYLQGMATAQSKFAGLLRRTGDTDQAIAMANAAMTTRQRIADANPDDLRAQLDLASAIQTIGDMHKRQHQFDDAGLRYNETLAIRQRLGRDHPRDLGVQRSLSSAHLRLGNLAMDEGDPDAALGHFEQVVAIRTALADRDDTNSRAQRDLMWALYFASAPLHALGRTDDATDALREAVAIAEQRRAADPINAEASRDWTLVSTQLASIMLDSDPAAAAATLGKLASQSQRLSEADPDNATLSIEHGVALLNYGAALALAGDHEQAIPVFERSATILQEECDRDAENRNALHDLARSMAGQGASQLALDDAFGAAASLQGAVNTYESLGADASADARVRAGFIESLAALAQARAELGASMEAENLLDRARSMLSTLPNDEETARIRQEVESVRLTLANGL